MPMHDWTTVEAGTYHTFHQYWAVEITTELNMQLLPPGYEALLERNVDKFEPDVITFQSSDEEDVPGRRREASVATLPMPQKAFVITAQDEAETCTRLSNRILVRTQKKKVVAMVEIVSPGNKQGKNAIQQFVKKSVDFLSDRVSVMVINPFPPGPRDPDGVHPLIWEHFDSTPFKLPKRKPLTFVSYQVIPERRAFIEPIAVRGILPDMPLFLKGDFYVDIPLEKIYMECCRRIPASLRADYQ